MHSYVLSSTLVLRKKLPVSIIMRFEFFANVKTNLYEGHVNTFITLDCFRREPRLFMRTPLYAPRLNIINYYILIYTLSV